MHPALITAAVLVVAGCTPAETHENPASDRSAAPSVLESPVTLIDGVPAVDSGPVRWEDGVVLRDPRELRVRTVGVDGPPTPCQVAVVVEAVRQTTSEVVIEARQYEMARKPQDYACPSIAQGPQPHELRLDAPLNGRTVLDASTHAPREVIAFDDFPTVQQVPAGYVWRPPTWDDERRVVTRSWGSEEGSLTLEIGPAHQLAPLPATLAEGRVGGRVATVTRVLMLSCARWGEPDRTLNLCSRDDMAGDPPLGPEQLLALASTVG